MGEVPLYTSVSFHARQGFRVWFCPVQRIAAEPHGLGVIRKEAWPFYRTISAVRLCWEFEEPKGPKGVRHILASQLM